MPRLEIRLPISPRPAWLNRTRLIIASIREFYDDAIFRIYVGEPGGPTPELVNLVFRELRGVGIEWINGPEFDAWEGTRSPYLATMNRRFSPNVIGDYVLALDADVLCVDRFDELFDVYAVQGMQAHVSPLNDEAWRHLFHLHGLEEPKFDHLYSGAGIMGPVGKLGPWYVNSGVVFAPRQLFEQLCAPYQAAIAFLRRTLADTYWFDQLALALAVAASGVPAVTIPPRYNFPNQADFDEAYPVDLAMARFIHYLRTDTIHRDRDFEDIEAIAAFLRREDLKGSNAAVQLRVAQLVKALLPPMVSSAEDAPYA